MGTRCGAKDGGAKDGGKDVRDGARCQMCRSARDGAQDAPELRRDVVPKTVPEMRPDMVPKFGRQPRRPTKVVPKMWCQRLRHRCGAR